jgi:serine/threonine protein kinase/tetratricopeptide (TPR) repeat protein
MSGTERDAKAIFCEALDRPAGSDRAAYLEIACRGDAALRSRVEALLIAYLDAGNFLESPAVKPTTGAAPRRTEGVGTVIGPYTLVEPIGDGGMGVVYLAEQHEPVRRRVALKVIKPGMDTRQVIARFEAERQALALMEHPNIARVYDAGTTDSGRPYFVMELVHGLPITEHCDRERFSPKDRLALFVSVCQAVQHAHQKGIIHRDLKSSNVLVTSHDGTPMVKVIDFGVAKAIDRKLTLTEKTLYTQATQMVGTPLYMSPEQAGLGGLDIDTRTDIYALGVLLYELLTGTTPFDNGRLGTVTGDEIRRIIREEEPPRPSTRISTPGPAAATASANRRSDPRVLRRLFRGELDWIVMKALEKDRNRRYETASAFAADVLRYLRDEPVQACPPSVGYRLRKFVRRNQGPVLAVSLVALALVAGLAVATWGMIRAEQARRDALSAQRAEARRAEGERRAREEAQKRLAQIETGNEILASVFRDLDPIAAENAGVPLRVALGVRLGEAARQLEGEVVGDPLAVARLQHVLGVSLRELGHLEQAERVLVAATRTRKRLLGADHLDTVATEHHLALLYRARANYAPAEALLKQVLATRTARLGADHPDTLASQHNLAWLYQSRRKYAQAEVLYQQVLAARTARLGADHPDTLTSQHRLAMLYRSQSRYDQAEALLKQVLAARTVRLGADHLDTVATKQQLAALYLVLEKLAPAEMLYRDVLAARTAKLGADHPDTLTTRHHLASLYQAQGKHAPAEALLKEVLAVRSTRLGADHPDTLANRYELAALYLTQGKYAPAEALLKEVLATDAARQEADHRVIHYSKYELAALYHNQGKYALAEPLYREVLATRTAWLGADHPETLGVQADVGLNYCAAGQFADGIRLLEEVHRKGGTQPYMPLVDKALLAAYARAGKTSEATALAMDRVQAARTQSPFDRSKLAAALAEAGRVLLDATAYADAELLLREGLALDEKLAPEAWATHHARSLLGGALLGQKKYADSEPLLVQGYEGLKEHVAEIPPEDRGSMTTALERLVELYDAWHRPEEAARWRKELERRKEAVRSTGCGGRSTD